MKKRGFTLIELVAVIAVMAVVLGFAVVMLAQLFDFQRENDEYAEGMRSADRFAVEFRNDVHTYGKPEILSDGTVLLRFKTERETIEYTTEPGAFPDQRIIVRTVQTGEEQPQFETYRLPDRTALHFADGRDADAGLFALSLWTAPKGTVPPKLDELNPFDRTFPKSMERQIDPKYAGNWRTIVVRY